MSFEARCPQCLFVSRQLGQPTPCLLHVSLACESEAANVATDPTESVRLLREALAMQPGYVEVYRRKAEVLLGRKDYREAAAWFDRYLVRQPALARA